MQAGFTVWPVLDMLMERAGRRVGKTSGFHVKNTQMDKEVVTEKPI